MKAEAWFVRCPVDGHYEFGLHCHIYYKCSCGHRGGSGIDEAGHTFHRAALTYRSGKQYGEALDAVIANPEPFFVTDDDDSVRQSKVRPEKPMKET